MAYRLERSLFLPRPREEVFAFFSEADNLERITPPFLNFHIITPGPIDMKAGIIIDYKLRLYGIPFHWRTLIETFEPPGSFSDAQLTGPYRRWHHLHEFIEVPGGTEMRDRVDYELPFRLFAPIIHPLFVRRSVQQIFDYRNKIIAEIFGAPDQLLPANATSPEPPQSPSPPAEPSSRTPSPSDALHRPPAQHQARHSR